jgi:hypothetical protein
MPVCDVYGKGQNRRFCCGSQKYTHLWVLNMSLENIHRMSIICAAVAINSRQEAVFVKRVNRNTCHLEKKYGNNTSYIHKSGKSSQRGLELGTPKSTICLKILKFNVYTIDLLHEIEKKKTNRKGHI